jgi:hypothetical protein
MKKLDLSTIQALEAAGIQFSVSFREPGGAATIGISADEAFAWVEDPEAFAARTVGLTTTKYREWVDSDGEPRCGAVTIDGHRCKNVISGGIQRSALEWLRLDGGYCAVHGGASSEEGRTTRRPRRV